MELPLAILIPANPFQYPPDSVERDRSDVEAHREHEQKAGCVYWNVPGSGRRHKWLNDVKTAYFCCWVSRSERRVIYKADIASRPYHFITKDEMRERFPLEELKCLYGTRKNVWKTEEEGGYNWETHWEKPIKWGFIFIKLRNIRKISERKLRDFKRALNEKGILSFSSSRK